MFISGCSYDNVGRGLLSPFFVITGIERNDLYYPCLQMIYGYKRESQKLFRKGLCEVKELEAEKFED